MIRFTSILATLILVLALPFIFQRTPAASDWKKGDPELVIISPHNEAIRQEFARAFSDWHNLHYGQPVKIHWLNIGGTTEIMRYLGAEYTAAFRAYWQSQGHIWPAGGGDMILDKKFNASKPPTQERERIQRDLYMAFRTTDNPDAFTCKIDLFFGGGTFDQDNAWRSGFTVVPWPADQPPRGTIFSEQNTELIPTRLGGEIWRTDVFFGSALSTFGICYNLDRLRDLGITQPPTQWADLAHPSWFGQLGVADPTKSGSIAKAFETLVHQQCEQAVRAAGYSTAQIDAYEQAFKNAGLPPGALPDGVPPAYQQAVESGWRQGVMLLQKIGANARYFTDAASKVPIDVGAGNAAAGISIDFYSRFEMEIREMNHGYSPMVFVTPTGGSSISADPIALLRGAEHREVAVRFMAFTLMEEGQRLWDYRPGTPGGPAEYSLRRPPIRRDFYPSQDPLIQAAYERHRPYLADDLGRPDVNPYVLAEQFSYHPRWTAGHYSMLRDLVRAMCLDSGEELRAAWKSILNHGGPGANPEAMRLLEQLPDQPEPLTWVSALQAGSRYDRMNLLRMWTLFFREQYRRAAEAASRSASNRGSSG